MIVTREWLQEFIDISSITTEDICIALNSIGLEVDAVEKVRIPDGITLGYVESKEKHPDADKLSVCQVNIGTETVQIVCGAKNVDKGQYVPVATIGTVLGEDFKIKKSKLRGVESNGMICSTTEIGLVKLNDGILELDSSIGELKIGASLKDYPLLNDDIITIELTANRGDCLNIKAIAKELGVYFNLPVHDCETKINEDSRAIGRILEIDYSNDVDASLIYKVCDLDSFHLPLLFELRAATVEASKGTDIETLVSYATHSTGVIFNTYTQAIAKDNEQIKLKIYKDEKGFTHVDGNIPLSTVGINNGFITNPDTTVVLEASYCEPTSLAQNVFTHKQKTGEVYYKASRGSNPNLEVGMNYLTTLLSSCGSSIYRGQIDFITDVENKIIDINYEYINKIIGADITKKEIEDILIALGFTQNKINEQNNVSWIVPNTRHDIVNIADVSEEIVRIIGIDNIPSRPLAMCEANRTNPISKSLILKNKIRLASISQGFFETNTYLFSSRELLSKYNFDVVKEELDILNPITNDLNTFRTTLLLNLILGVEANVKQGFKSINLFEIGTICDANRNETKKLAFVSSGKIEEENLSNKGKPKDYDFFAFANKISNIIGKFELENNENVNTSFFHPYQSANIMIDGKCVGFMTKLHPTVSKELDLSDATFVAEIDFALLEDKLICANTISKYQNAKRDLSIVVPKSLEFKAIKNVINALEIPELVQYNLIDIYHDANLGDNESITISFVLQSFDKTLEEEDITSVMDKILQALQSEVGATLR